MIPSNLNTPAFLEAWDMWQCHRKEIKHPITPTSAKMQLKKLSMWGEKRAIAAIEHSITMSWQGIYEEQKKQMKFTGTVSLGGFQSGRGGL